MSFLRFGDTLPYTCVLPRAFSAIITLIGTVGTTGSCVNAEIGLRVRQSAALQPVSVPQKRADAGGCHVSCSKRCSQRLRLESPVF